MHLWGCLLSCWLIGHIPQGSFSRQGVRHVSFTVVVDLLCGGRDVEEELVLLLRGLHNQISSSAHSSVVRGHVEFLGLLEGQQ